MAREPEPIDGDFMTDDFKGEATEEEFNLDEDEISITMPRGFAKALLIDTEKQWHREPMRDFLRMLEDAI